VINIIRAETDVAYLRLARITDECFLLEDIAGSQFNEVFLECVEAFSPQAIRLIMKKVEEYGTEIASAFFEAHKDSWDKSPETRWSTVEEFLLDAQTVQEIAKQRIAQKQPYRELNDVPIEMPEDSDDTTPTTLEVEMIVPSLEYHPDWFNFDGKTYVSFREDHDDTDYHLPSEFPVFERTSQSNPRSSDYGSLLSAFRSGDKEKQDQLLEQIIGLGEIPPDKKVIIDKLLDAVTQAWGIKEFNGEDGQVRDIIDRLAKLRESIMLPESGRPLEVHNKRLNKDRTIPSFETTILPHMLEVFVAGAVYYARQNDDGVNLFMEQMMKVELQTLKMYREVVDRGVPVFRDFVSWLNEEVRKTQERGGEHPGEFYVGRDTLQTLYPSAKAMRWGKMPGMDARKLTVFVNVSRPFLANMQSTQEMKEIMKAWLVQEGVTQEMFGIDGGYSGSGPLGVFTALDKDRNPYARQRDKQIRLISAQHTERRMDLRNNVGGFVGWMESLPKFADRAQRVLKTQFGRFFIEDVARSPVERVLAWTVQHAVWREMVNYVPEDRSPKAMEARAQSESFWGSDDQSPPLPEIEASNVSKEIGERDEKRDSLKLPWVTESAGGWKVVLQRKHNGWGNKEVLAVEIKGVGAIEFDAASTSEDTLEKVSDFWKDVVSNASQSGDGNKILDSVYDLVVGHFTKPDLTLFLFPTIDHQKKNDALGIW
jgi:hypothetical protein